MESVSYHARLRGYSEGTVTTTFPVASNIQGRSNFYANSRRRSQPFPIRPRSRFSTLGGTSPDTSPPKLTTSFTIRELTNE